VQFGNLQDATTHRSVNIVTAVKHHYTAYPALLSLAIKSILYVMLTVCNTQSIERSLEDVGK
jgi:hypothetical protein